MRGYDTQAVPSQDDHIAAICKRGKISHGMAPLSIGITPVSVRRARKRCRRKTTMSPQQATKVRCVGCKPFNTKSAIANNAAHKAYCTSCWVSWLEILASHRQCLNLAEGLKPQCVECGADAKLQGTNKFQGLGYCIPCSAKYLKKQDEFIQLQATALCDECSIRPVEHYGKYEFSGLSYCKECWHGWMKVNSVHHSPAESPRSTHSVLEDEKENSEIVADTMITDCWQQAHPLCAECKVQAGLFHGRQEFQNVLYCGECWLGWMESPRENDIAHGDPKAMEIGVGVAFEQSQEDVLAGLCAECKLQPGKHQGTAGFANESYCDECRDRWFEQRALEAADLQIGLCVECKSSPGQISGFNGFEGQAYCGPCWLAWQNEHLRQLNEVCAECKQRPGEHYGSNEFSNFKYCDQCVHDFRWRLRMIELDLGWCDLCNAAKGEHKGTQDFEGKAYCKRCWNAWREEAGLNALYGKMIPVTPDQDNHFDFIEVGTSTWGTVTQYCAGDFGNASALAAKIKSSFFNMYYARGLAVEPVRNHLDMLPSLPNVTKVYAAMDETSGENTLFYVSPANISRYMGQLYAALPSAENPDVQVDVMWYAMSLSRIGQPHPELEQMLKSVGRADLLESQRVCVLSWEDLCVQHHVASVDVVQLDCEGEDCAILRGMLTYCEQRPESFPRVIQFEANHLTDSDEIEATLHALQQRGGYYVSSRNDFNIIVQRNVAATRN